MREPVVMIILPPGLSIVLNDIGVASPKNRKPMALSVMLSSCVEDNSSRRRLSDIIIMFLAAAEHIGLDLFDNPGNI